MLKFNLIVVEFDLSSCEAMRVRRIVSALGLDVCDPEVVESIRFALREGGMDAFDPEFRCELWGVKVQYDPAVHKVDTARAAVELRVALGIRHVEWMPLEQSGDMAATFGFTCPEAWTGVLPAALGREIRRHLLEVVQGAVVESQS